MLVVFDEHGAVSLEGRAHALETRHASHLRPSVAWRRASCVFSFSFCHASLSRFQLPLSASCRVNSSCSRRRHASSRSELYISLVRMAARSEMTHTTQAAIIKATNTAALTAPDRTRTPLPPTMMPVSRYPSSSSFDSLITVIQPLVVVMSGMLGRGMSGRLSDGGIRDVDMASTVRTDNGPCQATG